MSKDKSVEERFEEFRKNFLSIQKKYDEKINELSIIKEMNSTMQQIDFIDQDLIWIRHLECLKKYKGLAAAALYFSPDNEIKKDHFFHTKTEKTFNFRAIKNLPFFKALLGEKTNVLIASLKDVEKKCTERVTKQTHLFSDEDYAFYGQSIVSKGKTIAILMLFGENNNMFGPSHFLFYNIVCDHLHNNMVFLRLYYGKLDEEKQMLQLSRFFSKNVIGEIFKQGKLRLGGEKKQAAVVFVDLIGFTSFSETMEPEEVVTLLNHFFSRMIPLIFKHRGTLDKLLGDGILAVFGTPLEDPDSCLNAVRTALEMFSELHALNREIKENFRQLEMSVGINYGELVAGFMGSEAHLNYTVVGDTVNVAQRIESLADPNRILVSDAVWKKIEPHVQTLDNLKGVTRLDEVKLKGKAKRVCLFQLEPTYS
ncbi:adenylate/guanylate cyclase domain-containing protein [uncultured Desulfobacter sp.]|uniref:adenylate/guanylate cyclase domain-containing protein n=1 Tax=uncultured Desulfobacter sp. TaxID=240139 RepID=UPI0029F45979|nr:adenylate/guanylate cyclase domain-containing protein [uncultured Desulfobacter sp.]